MKKILKRIVKLVLIIAIIFIIFLGYQYIKYINEENNEEYIEEQASADTQLEEELLEENMKKAQNFVKEINNNVALTILRTKGKITLSHDKTPQNNKWVEWLINSDIKVYATYQTAFTIEANSINSVINEDATVTLNYDARDITLSFVDITDISTSTNTSLLGSSYTPSQVAAFENIARDDIYEYTNSDTNISQAKKNLELYLQTQATNYGVTINIVEK